MWVFWLGTCGFAQSPQTRLAGSHGLYNWALPGDMQGGQQGYPWKCLVLFAKNDPISTIQRGIWAFWKAHDQLRCTIGKRASLTHNLCLVSVSVQVDENNDDVVPAKWIERRRGRNSDSDFDHLLCAQRLKSWTEKTASPPSAPPSNRSGVMQVDATNTNNILLNMLMRIRSYTRKKSVHARPASTTTIRGSG